MNASFAKQMPPPGRHLGHLPVRRAVHGHPRLGRRATDWAWPSSSASATRPTSTRCDFVAALAADDGNAGDRRPTWRASPRARSSFRRRPRRPRIEAGGRPQGGHQRRRGQGRLVPHRQPGRGRHRLRGRVPRSGIIRADTFEALFDYATALAMQPLPKGNASRSSPTPAGRASWPPTPWRTPGCGWPRLNVATADALREKLPAAASVGNPIDVLGDADPDATPKALDAAQDDDTVDAIIVMLTPQAMTRPADTARAIARRLRGTKPVLASFMGGQDVMPGREELRRAAGIPDYPSPERAVAALRAMGDYAAVAADAAARGRPVPGQPPPRRADPPPMRPDRRVRRSAKRRPRTSCGPTISTCPTGRIVTNADDADGRGGEDRLPGGDEDRLARHHPQVGPRRREAQPGHARGGARRVRPDDAADHAAACPTRASTASTSRRCARAAAR